MDSGEAAIIGAAIGAGSSLIVSLADRAVGLSHRRSDLLRTNRRELREALLAVSDALAAIHTEGRGTAAFNRASAASAPALARLDLELPSRDKAIATLAYRACTSVIVGSEEQAAAAVAAFSEVSGEWYRGEYDAESASKRYPLAFDATMRRQAGEDVSPEDLIPDE